MTPREADKGRTVVEKKMTNIRLDPALWARVKGAAGQRGITLERWVTEALEAQLYRGAPAESGAGPVDGPLEASAGAPGGERPGAPEDPLQALHWRVEALEHAVDYLAGVVGAGFPLGAGGLGGADDAEGGAPAAGNGAGPA
jgi:hypothetical protein